MDDTTDHREIAALGPRTGDPMIDRHLPPIGSFEDRIYAVAMGPSSDEGDMAWMSHVAHDILAMPEMQAIRARLRVCIDGHGWVEGALPPSVLAWIGAS